MVESPKGAIPVGVVAVQGRLILVRAPMALRGGAAPSTPRPSFFFQADDGIRDKLVTGVQTSTLPILPVGTKPSDSLEHPWKSAGAPTPTAPASSCLLEIPLIAGSTFHYARAPWHRGSGRTSGRSEERRVGKESRRGWGSMT